MGLIDYITNSKLSKNDPLYKKVAQLRGKIAEETNDTVLYQQEKVGTFFTEGTEDLLREIIQELQNITIQENR